MRIARTLALFLALVSLYALAAPATGQATSRTVPSGTSIAALGGLVGEDENEPDENEADEGGSEEGRSAASAGDGNGASLPHLLLAVGLGAVAMAFAARWFFRIRSWMQQSGNGRAAG